MNIIAFVLGILMIFAITTNTLFKKRISDDVAQKSFSGYMVASRKAFNKAEDELFKNVKEKPKEKNNSNNKASQDDKIRSVKTQRAKINIYRLVRDKKENQKELYNLVASLIRTLYSNKSFYNKNFEHYLLDNMLKAFDNQLEKDKNVGLANLVLKKSSLQKTYYRILKGTKFYDFNKKEGIPSLLDFIKYENSNAKIPIKDASMELLTSVFNASVAREINILQKQNPPKNLTHSNVLSLCQHHSKNINEDILDLFDFSNSLFKDKDKIIVGIDKQTNIKVKKRLSL